jgi:hypothetical protein
MKSKKVVSSFRVGQVVTYRGERVRIKAFPNPHTAVVVPEIMVGARWTVKTVAISDLVR